MSAANTSSYPQPVDYKDQHMFEISPGWNIKIENLEESEAQTGLDNAYSNPQKMRGSLADLAYIINCVITRTTEGNRDFSKTAPISMIRWFKTLAPRNVFPYRGVPIKTAIRLFAAQVQPERENIFDVLSMCANQPTTNRLATI